LEIVKEKPQLMGNIGSGAKNLFSIEIALFSPFSFLGVKLLSQTITGSFPRGLPRG